MAVRHYKITLSTVGPVHIGNGETYGKKDYFVLDDKSVGILRADRFVGQLAAKDLEDYCRFLETDSSNSFQDFLRQHPQAERLAHECVAYRVETPLAKARRGSIQNLGVKLCIKDAYGCPYVPGSSVKGMLRTALLTYLVQQSPAKYAELYEPQMALGRERGKACRQIEHEAFRRLQLTGGGTSDATNDIMRYVSVSDSNPLSTGDLVFAKKYDKFARSDPGTHKLAMGKISRESTYREGNELNIYRECIRPDTRIEMSLDVDEHIDAFLGGLSLDCDGLTSVLEASYELYRDCFLKHFDLSGCGGSDDGGADADDGRCRYIYKGGPLAGRRCRNRAVGGTGYCNTHKDEASAARKQVTCYLGGGVDFTSKTIVNALFGGRRDRVYEISRILYAQFYTELDPTLQKNQDLGDEVREAGFVPEPMSARYSGSRLTKGKDDHRHWKDAELGVSPHTVKLGIIGSKKYPMGKCSCTIEERQ